VTKNGTTAENTWADPKNLGINDRSFFKPEDGKTRRIKLMGDPVRAHVQYVKELGFIRSFTEYKDVNGVLILENEGLDMELLGKEPQLMWMVPVLVYDTDKKGSVGNKKPANIEYEFQLWSFYAADYKKLFGMVMEWGIDDFNKKDILVTGIKKGRYLNAELAIAAKDAVCLQAGIKERVETEFAAYQYRDANKWIARTVTEDELQEAVGVNGATGSAPKGSASQATKS
jgi:hypothetical protein